VLDTVDLHSLRQCRQQLFKQSQGSGLNEVERNQLPPITANAVQLRQAMAHDDMAQREIAAIFRCDLSLLISPVEIEFLQQQFAVPAMLLHFCNLMLIPASQLAPDYHQRNGFFSIGNFRHAPNWDAVLWLKHAIWPKIREKLPDAQLSIAGAYPPPKLSQLHMPRQGFMCWAGFLMLSRRWLRHAFVWLPYVLVQELKESWPMRWLAPRQV